MNRFFFFLVVAAVSGAMAYFSMTAPAVKVSSDVFDFSMDETFTGTSLLVDVLSGSQAESFSGELITSAKIARLSPVSSYSYISRQAPELSTKSSGKVLKIGTGLYFFNLGDVFETYRIEHKAFMIRQLGRGSFLVDTRRPTELKIFSVSALLSTDLLTWGKLVTKVHVFPSSYFAYDPKMNSELAEADVIRISSLNTLRYVNLLSEAWAYSIFGEDAASRQFFHANLKVEKNRGLAIAKEFDDFFKIENPVSQESIFEDFSWYFVNREKQASILKGKFFRNVKKLAIAENCEEKNNKKCEGSAKIISSVAESVFQLNGFDQALADKAKDLLKKTYYLSYYKTPFRNDSYFLTRTSNGFVSAAIRSNLPISVENDNYAILSEMYSAYYFGNKNNEALASYLGAYIQSLLSGKSITKTDFLPFSYFLKEFLTQDGLEISSDYLKIAGYLVVVSNEYYNTLATDSQRFSTLTVTYFTYSKVLDRILKLILSKFYVKSDIWLVLKDEYLINGIPEIPSGFLDSLELLQKSFGGASWEKQKSLYDSFLAKDASSDFSETYMNFDKRSKAITRHIKTLSNYEAYLNELSLDANNRNARGKVIEKGKVTPEKLEEYFSEFSWVDMSTFKILNDYEKDGFFLVSIKIVWREFNFETLPSRGNTIRKLTFVDESGTRIETYKNISISLDSKKKQMSEAWSAVSPDDPRKELYKFENIFINLFLKKQTDFITRVTDDPIVATSLFPKMTTQMTIFANDELINKDFRNIYEYFPIKISNVYVTIKEGKYEIQLGGILKDFGLDGARYDTEFSGEYSFESHSFVNLKIKVSDMSTGAMKFWGIEIPLAPRRISLEEFEESTKDLYHFIALVNTQYLSKGTVSNVLFNLNTKKVVIDGTEFDVIIPKK